MTLDKLEFDKNDPHLMMRLFAANVPKVLAEKWAEDLKTVPFINALSLPDIFGKQWSIVIK
jgi:hypothetical protein